MSNNNIKSIIQSFTGVIVVIMIDVLLRYSIEDLKIVEVKPRVFFSNEGNDVSGYFSSLVWQITLLGWVYLLYYLVCYYSLSRIVNWKKVAKIALTTLFYLLFSLINEDLIEGLRYDKLLVSLIAAIPISILTFSIISFIQRGVSIRQDQT